MRGYGGHYKVNGPPVNLPATLDQIIDILPCMPHQLLLHPLKLKHKLEYKSHYMYDVIHRDKVISAIMWLKEHNYHYANIKLNEEWYNSDIAADLSVLLDDDTSCSPVTKDTSNVRMLRDGNHCTNSLNGNKSDQDDYEQSANNMPIEQHNERNGTHSCETGDNSGVVHLNNNEKELDKCDALQIESLQINERKK